jgi:hypothetical protein
VERERRKLNLLKMADRRTGKDPVSGVGRTLKFLFRKVEDYIILNRGWSR